MNNQSNFHPHTLSSLAGKTMDLIYSHCLIWDSDDRLMTAKDISEIHPNARDVYVTGRPYEEILRMEFEYGIFKLPKKMTVEQWIYERMESRKLGTYSEIRLIGERWFRFRNRRTENGYTMTTIIDMEKFKRHKEELDRLEAHTKKEIEAKDKEIAAVEKEIKARNKEIEARDKEIKAIKKKIEQCKKLIIQDDLIGDLSQNVSPTPLSKRSKFQ